MSHTEHLYVVNVLCHESFTSCYGVSYFSPALWIGCPWSVHSESVYRLEDATCSLVEFEKWRPVSFSISVLCLSFQVCFELCGLPAACLQSNFLRNTCVNLFCILYKITWFETSHFSNPYGQVYTCEIHNVAICLNKVLS